MIKSGLPLILCLLIAAAAPAADTARFPRVRELRPDPAADAGPIGVALLDDELYAGADAPFGNLRVVAADGSERPFVVRTRHHQAQVRREETVPARQAGFEVLPDNRIRIVLAKDPVAADRTPIAVEFDTALRNYEKQVTVYGSRDGAAWEVLAQDEPVFDYTRYLDARRTRVPVRAGDYTQYRIEVAKASESQPSPLRQFTREQRGGAVFAETERGSAERQDFRINAVRLLAERIDTASAAARIARRTLTNLTVRTDSGAQASVVTFALPGLPVTALALVCPDENFDRRVTVEARPGPGGVGAAGGSGAWREVAGGRACRVNIGSFHHDQVRISFASSQRAAEYRVTVYNQDNPPLRITGLDVESEETELVFLRGGGEPYRVWYGALDVEPPRYDMAGVLARAPAGDFAAFGFGPGADNPDCRARNRLWAGRGRTLMVAAVVAVVVLLFVVIAVTAKRTVALPEE